MADGRRAYGPLLAALAVVGASLLLAPPAQANTGGPDTYGYIWVDSRTPSPTVPYSWIDIVPLGVRLTLGDDDCTFEVSLGFQFRFYGTIVDEVYVCSDGFLTFSVPDSFQPDPPIPSPLAPNDRVVALGMDLDPGANGTGGVYVRSLGSQTPRRFVVTWDGVFKRYTTQRETFQIVLEQNETSKDGRILMQYRSLDGVAGPLVGIENKTGSSGLTYPGPFQNNLAVMFLPPSDAALPPDVLSVTAAAWAPPSVFQGDKNVPMMQLDLSTAANEVLFNGLDITLSGLGAGAEDVPSAGLWLDDGDGLFTVGDALLATASLAGAPAVATFGLTSPIGIAPGASRRLFVSYNVGSRAGVGDWIGARLPGPSAVTVVFPDVVSPTGMPFDTYLPDVRTRIDASRDTLTLSAAIPLASANVSQWSTDTPALALRFDADRNFIEVIELRVDLGGNGSFEDVWAAKALRDRDADGAFTPGTDDVLAIATPAGTPPSATLPIALTVFAGTPERVLIVLDIAPNATLGHILNVTVNATGVLLNGSLDTLDPANFPAAGGNATIVAGLRPALRLPWATVPPVPEGTWGSDEYFLGPGHTVSLDRPAGNRAAGFLTAENNGTVLYLAVDAIRDTALEPGDGLTIAFDTDGDGLPTAGADDVFIVNASGAARFAFNGTLGVWTLIEPCNPWAGDASISACVAGTGATALGPTPHRFYELQVPLSRIGVATPFPPGTSVRFALGGAPHLGLADGGNTSSWPLLFGPIPPLLFFGELALSTGPVPNQPPSLNWTGTPGYEADGVDPDSGLPNATFTWRIAYFDGDDDPPAVGQPVLHVLRDGTEITDSPFLLAARFPADANHLDGKEYLHLATNLTCGGNYTYWFAVRDDRGLRNETPILPGPQVVCPNRPPTLSGENVSPFVGEAGTAFTYRVAYADPEGAPPVFVQAYVRRGDANVTNFSLGLVGWIGTPGNYAQGALYAAATTLAEPGYNYTFRFRAADTEDEVETSWVFGPYVLIPPPDVLTVAGVDLAPLFVDEGSRRVPFLQLYLLTSDPEVNVTSVRVDRIGSASDLEVERILLYHDADENGAVNGVDVLLGSRPPLLGSATFPLSLRITPSSPASIIFLANLTRPGTADASVGLEVRNATFLTVGPGDVVQSFPVFRSTRALVNVAPAVADRAVDGHEAGSPQIEHIVPDAPDLSWRFTDANGADLVQAAYNASVWSVSPLALLWHRNESGSAASVPYAGPPLVDGQSYLMQVAVSDGRLWSPPAQVLFRMNTPPPAPTLLAPSDLATDVDPNPTLLWDPVADAEGDGITYWYWVSEDVGFATAIAGSTIGPGATLALSEGTTYYWKVASSDYYEVAGNATVWRFTTAAEIIPVRGEIRGRVLHGTVPIREALVELLADASVVAASITGLNGTFRFRDLDLRAYVVRASAFGFRARTVDAAPTLAAPVVDFDVALEPYPDDGGGTSISGIPSWFLVVVAAILIACLTTASFAVFLAVRRRRETSRAPIEDVTAVTAETVSVIDPVPTELLPQQRVAAKEDAPETVTYECPQCGRQVSAEATQCVCGVVFSDGDA